MCAIHEARHHALIAEAERIADLADLAARTAADGAQKAAGTPAGEVFRLAITRLRAVGDNMQVMADQLRAAVAA